MKKLFHRFYEQLPVYSAGADEHLHILNDQEVAHIRRYERVLLAIGCGLSVVGFLIYYLPVYWYPELFPTVHVKVPFIGPIKFPWGESVWCIVLTVIELILLTMVNIAGVHGIAIGTGFISSATRAERGGTVLQLGLEAKSKQITQYGIDPFQGLNTWALLLFNTVLRLKGWFGNRVVRFLVRLLLGRYAVRTMLDFAGMPIYMWINAISVRSALREARVVIMGRAVIELLLRRLPQQQLSQSEKRLLYDTFQYIAVSKRDFHENHYLLTRNLMTHFNIPVEPKHPLPDDYLPRLGVAPQPIADLCKMVILLGFILDGYVSLRERLRLRHLNRAGIMLESFADVRRYARDYLAGAGVESWSEPYLARIEARGSSCSGVT